VLGAAAVAVCLTAVPSYAAAQTGRPMSPGSSGAGFELGQNYPNPFNPETTIRFQLAEARHVTLAVYDVLGRAVATLADEALEAGAYQVHWDGTDRQGRPVASGTYLYRLEAGDFVQVRAMSLVK
jgi:hypothetical protein